MKNFINISLFFFSVSFFLYSCGNSSTKGSWSSSDLIKCKSEIKKGMYEEGGQDFTDEFWSEMGTTTDSICACMCEKLEKDYSSFREADNDPDLLNLSEVEAGEMLLSCIPNNDIPSTEDGWSKAMRDAFMIGCTVDPSFEDYCSCLLEELMEKYTTIEASSLTADDFAKFDTFDDCISLIY